LGSSEHTDWSPISQVGENDGISIPK
jgi:hypothetical protein